MDSLDASLDPYEAHLALVTDLLNPDPGSGNADAILASLAHHVVILDNAALSHLLSVALISPALWINTTAASTSGNDSSAQSLSLLHRVKDIFGAVRYGISTRIEQYATLHGTGWKGKQRIRRTLHAVWTPLRKTSTHSDPTARQLSDLARTTLASATLRALLDMRARSEDLSSAVSWCKSRAEHATVATWAEWCRASTPNADHYDSIAWVAAQILPDIDSQLLQPIAAEVGSPLFASRSNCLNEHIF